MAKSKSVFVCQNCGAKYPKWGGQCGQCGQWQTLVEEIETNSSRTSSTGRTSRSGGNVAKVARLSEIDTRKADYHRLSTGSVEFDRVLGGGIVPGSVVLIAGEPGIGKSTLLTQLVLNSGSKSTEVQVAKVAEVEKVAKEESRIRNSKQYQNSNAKNKSETNSDFDIQISDFNPQVLYACGEESVEQVGMRVERLKQNQELRIKNFANTQLQNKNLSFLATTNVDDIVATLEVEKPDVVVVDSIQTLNTGDLTGMAGSVGQIRESCFRLIEVAKRLNISIFIVGHVTKGGEIAGPKVLEHMVDTVLQLTGERTGRFRLLRAVKNRFGATDEVGVFSMEEAGMVDVANASEAFLAESQNGVAGSAIVVVMEGTRPILIEVQALVVETQLAMPRRVTNGVGVNKLQVIAAVLQKSCGLRLGERDIFINIAGGMSVSEPAADLGIALAIASSYYNKPLAKGTVCVGEVGLLGELRHVSFLEKRIKEAEKLGYPNVYIPKSGNNLKQLVNLVK